MTETRRMQLHLGKCIDDLDKLHIVPDLKTKRATVLCKSAIKLFEKAEEAREKGDEEYSYVYYMKYLRVIAFLSKDKEYLKDKSYFNNMLGTKNPNKAIDAAENLKKSLIERYDSERKDKRNEPNTEDNVKKSLEPIPTVEVQPAIVVPGPDEVVINCETLYSFIKSKIKLIILDVRPGKDFTESHINLSCCISVPEEIISPGQSANMLEQNLPLTSRAVWAERAKADLVVLLDWNTTNFIPGSPLFLLKTVLTKWDIKVHYAHEPVALLGGYEEWLLRYPSCTTNPRVIVRSGPTQMDFMDDLLGDITYPNWSDLVPPSSPGPPAVAPPPTPVPVPTSKPAPAALLRPVNTSEPLVDRSSKAAAERMYEERARSMQLILDQQQHIADTSVTLELQRIEAEKDWDRVRVQQEAEKRDEMRAEYKLREQEIISQLMQLENKQYDMELENQTLREKLEEYQRREKQEAEKLAEALSTVTKAGNEEVDRQQVQAKAERALAAKRARIAAVTEQKDQLDRQRETMELERKRKLAEARDKKKPALEQDKDEDGDVYMVSPDSPGATGLTRSRSSPHLVKQEMEEDEPATPAFDRSTKPIKVAPVNNRRFIIAPVLWGEVGRGLTGLMNLGNTCYMNSILQCLSNTASLANFFIKDAYVDHINRTHSTRGLVAEELAAVVKSLWSGQYKHISPKSLRTELGRHQRTFRESQQQDSHEFLTILMDWLHLDLQFHKKPPPLDTLAPSDKAWYEFSKAKESVILRLFYGQIKSTVRCNVCSKESVTYETFSNLSLELPANANRCTLSDCLRLYLNGETIIGWNCPGCRDNSSAVKKLDISRLPPILVVHFKRFFQDPTDYQDRSFQKKLTYIDFPLTDLDMSQFSLSCPFGKDYELYAVSNHYGSIQSGHYTAACKSNVYRKWYKYDDHAVAEIPPSDVKSSAAYILFYSTTKYL